MPYKIIVKNRIAWRNGDYIGYVSNNKLVMDYINPKQAMITYEAMKTQKMDCYYNGDKRIIQRFINMSENKLIKQMKLELDTVIKNKTPFQKISYVVEDIKEDKWEEKN